MMISKLVTKFKLNPSKEESRHFNNYHHSTFNIQHSKFIVHSSSFIAQHSTFNTQHLKLALFFLLNFFVLSAKAQWLPPCEDTLRRNPFFQCNEPFFRPVCGCNNKTYRNECVSYNVHGINVIKNEGVCREEVFQFDFYPNPSIEYINFSVEFFDQGNISVQIFDTYGKLMYLLNKPNLHRLDEVISTGGFQTGLYVITVTSGSTFKAKKLIVR